MNWIHSLVMSYFASFTCHKALLRAFCAFGLFLVMVLGSGCTTPMPTTEQDASVAMPVLAVAPEPPPVRISIAAVGDVMLGTDYPDNRLPPDDGAGQLSAVAAVFQAADITFANLEGTLLDGGQPAKQCRDNGRCYVFRSPARYATHLEAAGIDVVSLANNHARDFGEEGRSGTMAALDAVGIQHSGREGDIARWQVKGKSVAMIAFAPYWGSHQMLDLDAAREKVSQLAEENDLLLVSFHGGAEGADKLHVPFAPETYYGEQRGDVVAFSRAMVDAGADVVIGHGPHVPRALELYQGRLIAYSLGNFATYRGVNIRGVNGLAPILTVVVDGEGAFVSGKVVSARQYRPYGPQLDDSHEAASLMSQLSSQDFPGGGVRIADDGTIGRMDNMAQSGGVQ